MKFKYKIIIMFIEIGNLSLIITVFIVITSTKKNYL